MLETVTTKEKLISLMLQMQDLLMEEYEDNADIQDAFNALASAFDYYLED